MLRKVLGESNEGRPYLVRAHYYWFAELIRPFELGAIPFHRSFTGAQQVKIRQTAWHAKKLAALVSAKPQTDSDGQSSETPNPESEAVDPARIIAFLATTRLSEADQVKCHHQAAAALLLSSVFARSEGEIGQARRLVEDALVWLPAGAAAEPAWVSFAAQLLWSSYWISLDTAIRARLEFIARENPTLSVDPVWIVHQQFEDLLKGDLKSSANPPAQPVNDSDLCNLLSLTALLLSIRLAHGFTREGLSDAGIALPDAKTGEDAPWAEFLLRDLRTTALIYRGDWKQAEQALSTIREQLRSGGEVAEPIHMRVNRLYQSARYHHLLLEYWSMRSAVAESLPDEEREKNRSELESYLTGVSNVTGGHGFSARDALFDRAQADYRSVMQIGAWLSFHSILLEAGFHLGCLLLDFTPDDTKTQNSSWWNEWERLFQGCLRIEKQSGWQLHTPEIYRRQSEYFGVEDKSAAISDSFNTLQAVRKAGYPDDVVLEWHSNTRSLLTDYAQTQEDYKRSAELSELWARDLAVLPQAAGHRTFRHSLQLEQANALDFAAQAERQAGNLKRAEALNLEANELCRLALSGEHGEDPERARDLGIGIRMEHAWIVSQDSNRRKEYGDLMRGIWRDLDPTSDHCANVLGCIVSIEEDESALNASWPSIAGAAGSVDPKNASLSLPDQWFQGPEALVLENRFQFCFYQMLHMISDNHDPMARVVLEPGGRQGWRAQERFGESMLKLARIEMKGGYLRRSQGQPDNGESSSGDQRSLLIILLEAVAQIFSAEGDAEHQIESYHLLILFEPAKERFRLAYAWALTKHRQFLDREMRARALERADWFATARRLDYYFNILVDKGLFESWATEQLLRNGQTVEAFNSALEQLENALLQARSHFIAERDRECIATLDPVLDLVPSSWVAILHLEALDIWIRSASRLNRTGRLAPSGIEMYNMRAALLREMTLRYISQFGLTIQDPTIQQLAVQLFETLRDAIPEGQNIAGALPDVTA